MNRILLILCALLSGCVTTPEFMATESGYAIRTTFGTLTGSYNDASAILDKEANRLCGGEFEVVSERQAARMTAWGAENGQIDLFRTIRCEY